MQKNIDGILLVDKPEGMTSHDVVDFVRKRFQIKKVGHSGTLDPMATGILVMLLGNATKLSKEFTNLDKEYLAEMTLGAITDTADAQGKIIKEFPKDSYKDITRAQAEDALGNFKGEIEQVPPMVSALRFKGKRLYKLARKGIKVTLQPRKIKVYELELTSFEPPKIAFRVTCSKGTYVRKLCEDIGEKLGCGAHQSKLRRTRVGDFTIQDSVALGSLDESHIRNN